MTDSSNVNVEDNVMNEEVLVRIEVVDHDNQLHIIEVPPNVGLNVMEACIAAELPIDSTCGGMALCGNCHVYILSDHMLREKSEEETLDKSFFVKENSRLCCQIRVSEKINGLKIKLAPV